MPKAMSLTKLSSMGKVFYNNLISIPLIIVLDVMMPGVDGWEVLGNLRQNPVTSSIPIVVCTILPQVEMARLLGASAFLSKPVTRHAFLAVLTQQTEATAPESRSRPGCTPTGPVLRGPRCESP